MLAPATCPNCQFPLAPTARACPRCGRPVRPEDAPTPADPAFAGVSYGASSAPPTGMEAVATGSSAWDSVGPGRYSASETPPGPIHDAAPVAAEASSMSGETTPTDDAPVAPAAPDSLAPVGNDAATAVSANGDAPLPPAPLPVRPVRSSEMVIPSDGPPAPPADAPSAIAASVPPAPVVAPAGESAPGPAPMPRSVWAPPPAPAPGTPSPEIATTILPALPVTPAVPSVAEPAAAPAPAPAAITAPAAAPTAGVMVLLPQEEVITQLGALYLTNKRVILYAPTILRAAFLRDVDAVGTLTERSSGWTLFFALLLLGLTGVGIYVAILQNQPTTTLSLPLLNQFPIWLIVVVLAVLAGLLLASYFFWVKKSLFLSVGGRPLIVISLSGWSPKRLEGVDTFINAFSQAKDAAEYPQDGR